MYIPEYFREQDIAVLHQFVERYNFATLVTQEHGQMIASHIPFVLDRAAAPFGALRAHIAKKNPQLEHLKTGSEALVIFQGPHSYISPMWYANQRNVPTWNYAVVHAYGTPRMLQDSELVKLLEELVAQHEAPVPKGWSFDPAERWIEQMLAAIGGFEIPISKLEGKVKMNQNRTEADRAGVIGMLELSEDPMQRAVAELMKEAKIRKHGTVQNEQ